jgi:hydrogenase nickel incorporation protein HypA/HybF
MHELSIALSLIEVASKEAERLGDVEVLAMHLKLGPLSGVVKEALLSAYDLAREGSPLAACRLEIEDVPIIAWCPACAAETPIESIQELCCPACRTPTPDIRHGQELEVTALEIAE